MTYKSLNQHIRFVQWKTHPCLWNPTCLNKKLLSHVLHEEKFHKQRTRLPQCCWPARLRIPANIVASFEPNPGNSSHDLWKSFDRWIGEHLGDLGNHAALSNANRLPCFSHNPNLKALSNAFGHPFGYDLIWAQRFCHDACGWCQVVRSSVYHIE